MYLPFNTVNETEFPKGVGKDLNFSIRVLKQKWKRFYPELPYYSLRLGYDELETTQDADDSNSDGGGVIQVPTYTAVDDLWGEDLPGFDTNLVDYSNPHSVEDSPEASDVITSRKFEDENLIHCHVLEEATEYRLKKMGRDMMNDLIVTFLTPLLDISSLVIKSGDEFSWNGERYVLLDAKHRGYWKMTNLFLFVECNCEKVRYAS